jgi:DNA-binding CsgD family transcriptional regulator
MAARNTESLIASFYEAAAGRGSWHAAMHCVADHLDCVVAQVIGVNWIERKLIFSFEGGSGAPEGVIDYARTYHRIDPHAEHLAPQPVGTLVAYSREFDPAFIERHAFYQDYLIPYGVRHTHAAKLYQDREMVAFLGLHRAVGKEPIDGADWEVAQRLSFHLVRAMQIFIGMRRTLAEAVVGRETLDRLSVPVLLIDEQRRVVVANRVASQAMDSDWSLFVDQAGHLCCRLAKADSELTLAVRSLQLSGKAGLQSGAPRERAVIRVPSPQAAKPLLACLVALRPDATMGAFGHVAVVMVVVHDPNQTARIDPFALAAAFELSPAEARVAVALANGASPKEIARNLGVSPNTVRSQVQAVHHKFGVSRTAELVALIHSSSFGLMH